MFSGFLPNLVLISAFRSPLSVPNFSLIRIHVCTLCRFCKVFEKPRKQTKKKKPETLVVRSLACQTVCKFAAPTQTVWHARLGRSYLGNGLGDFLQISYMYSPTARALQQHGKTIVVYQLYKKMDFGMLTTKKVM